MRRYNLVLVLMINAFNLLYMHLFLLYQHPKIEYGTEGIHPWVFMPRYYF